MGESELNGLMELSKILNFSKFMAVCMAIFALWLLVKGLNKIADRISLQFPNRRLLLLQIVTILAFLIYIGGGILVVYGILKPPKELMIALGGSAAVAIGLSLKDLVASLVAGFILLFEFFKSCTVINTFKWREQQSNLTDQVKAIPCAI